MEDESRSYTEGEQPSEGDFGGVKADLGKRLVAAVIDMVVGV